jgi:hypothetical protein
VSPVRYKLGFYIPKDGILQVHKKFHGTKIAWFKFGVVCFRTVCFAT